MRQIFLFLIFDIRIFKIFIENKDTYNINQIEPNNIIVSPQAFAMLYAAVPRGDQIPAGPVVTNFVRQFRYFFATP